jgi:hypothetical protein
MRGGRSGTACLNQESRLINMFMSTGHGALLIAHPCSSHRSNVFEVILRPIHDILGICKPNVPTQALLVMLFAR